MTRAEQIEQIKAKIRARENRAGFAGNVADLKARLVELEAQQ